MTTNKGTTRGKPRIAPTQGGGAVREIHEDRVADAFCAAFGCVAPKELVAEVSHRLRFRIVDVDNPPAGSTKRQVEAVANAAKRLQRNLEAMPGSRELLEEIAWLNPSCPMDSGDFLRFLVHLQSADDLAESKSPATAYRTTIKAIAAACEEEGVQVSKTEGGAFLRFLNLLEEAWPGLIFPHGTAPQIEARRDYLRESLAA